MKGIIKILVVIMFLLFCTTIFGGKVEAATVNITANPTSVKVGTKVTINVQGTAAAWSLYVNGDGIEEKAIVGYTEDDEAKNESFSDSVTFTPTKAGKYTIKLTGTIVDETQTEGDSVSKSVTITAEEEEKPTNTDNNTSNNETTDNSSSSNSSGENTSSGNSDKNSSSGSDSKDDNTKPKEPTFTSANRTVYTTGETVNLRSSWSTSSNATPVPEGTELTLTGTSTQMVNGYVWYRVEYNGTTKYVASGLVSDTKPEEEEKSDNNNLSLLEIEGITLTPEFSKEVLQYTAQIVGEEITKLEVNAEVEDDKAKVEINGNEGLIEGENTIKIVVTAEDNTTKTYTVKVTKVEETVENTTPTDGNLKLSELQIGGVDFENGFDPDLYSYELTLNVAVEALDITAKANQEDAKIEIVGNENFIEGQNIVMILLTSADETESASYQIKVNMPATATETQNDIQFYLICGGVAIAVVIVIIIIVVICKRKNRYDEFWDDEEESDVDKKDKKGVSLLEISEMEKKPKSSKGRHYV